MRTTRIRITSNLLRRQLQRAAIDERSVRRRLSARGRVLHSNRRAGQHLAHAQARPAVALLQVEPVVLLKLFVQSTAVGLHQAFGQAVHEDAGVSELPEDKIRQGVLGRERLKPDSVQPHLGGEFEAGKGPVHDQNKPWRRAAEPADSD